MRIAIPLFDGVTALDAIGPYEVLSRLPGAEISFVAAEPGPKRTDNRMLALHADVALADLTDPEILLIPGGYGTRKLMKDEAMLAWVRGVHASSQWTTSVCTGALVLAAAGVLEGLEATTHWLSLEILRASRPGSTWRWCWRPGSRVTRWRRPSSSRSSTTRSRPSTRARRPRRRRRSRSSYAVPRVRK